MRYFFNQTGVIYDPDDEGIEIASLDEARVEAVRYAAEVMRDHPTLVWHGEDFRTEVTNSDQLLLFTVILVIGVDSPATANR